MQPLGAVGAVAAQGGGQCEAGRVIAEIRGYADFTAALRSWVMQVGTTYESIGEVAGLQPGYLAKLISSTPIRSFSRMSLDATLAAMGVKLLLVPDGERLELMRPRLAVRTTSGRKPTSASIPAANLPANRNNPLANNPVLATYYAHRRAAMQSPRRRRQIARKAIAIRWRRERAKGAEPAL
jgi:hypothetical protein